MSDDFDPIGEAIDNAAPPDLPGADELDCPVRALGFDGLKFAFQVGTGDVVELAAKELSHKVIVALFGGDDRWLYQTFPETDAKGKVTGWNERAAFKSLVRRCVRAGRFDSRRDLRGAGVWRYELPADQRSPHDPPLIVHCGTALWAGELDRGGRPVFIAPQRLGPHVYAATRPDVRPGDAAATIDDIRALSRLVASWSWARPKVDPVLLIGWIAVATIVGAVDWRPSIWLSGDRGTGKSYLQLLIETLLDSMLETLSDGTEAAVRQLLRRSARPIALDELEAEEVNDKALALVKLARLGATRGGGRIARGSSDGEVTLFNIDACFLFSSILRPPLAPADLQRVTILELRPLKGGGESGTAMRERIATFAGLGARIRRRMVQDWARFLDVLHLVQQHLAAMGHTARGCDQLGTLIAAAWTVGREGLPDYPDALAAWTEGLSPEELAVRNDDMPDHMRCALHLITAPEHDYSGGRRRTIGELINLAISSTEPDGEFPNPSIRKQAQRDLGRIGLKVIFDQSDVPQWLAISNTHDGTARLFEGTHWAAKKGVSGGGWLQAFHRFDGWQPSKSIRFGQASTKAVLVPIRALPLFARDEDDDVTL